MNHTKDMTRRKHHAPFFLLVSILLICIFGLLLTGCSQTDSSNEDESNANLLASEDASLNLKEAESSEEATEAQTEETEPETTEPETTEPETTEPETSGTTTSGEPNPDEKVVYITIDDGPTKDTPKILDILDEYNAKATWFVTGQYLSGDAMTEMLQEIYNRGHAIGVHTYSHEYKAIYKSVEAYMEDYNKMNDIVVAATGESSGLFRFPGGSNAGYNKSIRDELISRVNSEGLVYYDWNAFTGDTEGMTKDEMVSKAVKESSYNNKTILLMHDVPGKDAVVEALPEILQALQDKGYEFRALDKDVTPIQFAK